MKIKEIIAQGMVGTILEVSLLEMIIIADINKYLIEAIKQSKEVEDSDIIRLNKQVVDKIIIILDKISKDCSLDTISEEMFKESEKETIHKKLNAENNVFS